MPLPQIGGHIKAHYGANTALVSIDIVPIGSWMLLSVMVMQETTVVTPPAGWVLLQSGESGSRANFLFGKIKTENDGSTAVFSHSAAGTSAYALLYGANSGSVANWIIGTPTRRVDSGEPSGARYTNRAASVTIPSDNYLVVAVSNEATTAFDTAHEIDAYTNGWTERVYVEQVALGDRIETAWMGTKNAVSAGATGDMTVKYISNQNANGWAVQVAIPYATPTGVTEVDNPPYVVGDPSTTISSGTSITVARPNGALTGDYIVVALRGQGSGMTADPSSVGFSRLGPAFEASMATRLNGLYGRPIADISSEPSSYTFSVSNDGGRLVASAFIVRDVDSDNPVAGFYDDYDGITSGSALVRSGAYTASSSPVLSIFYAGAEFTAPNDHVPTQVPEGYTEVVSAVTGNGNFGVSRSYMYVGTRQVTGGLVSETSIGWTASVGRACEGVSLRGTMGAPISPRGEGVAVMDGSGQEVRVYHTIDNDDLRTPSALVPIRRGFDSVAHMLATPGFTWAHRGGSRNWPEMSLHAYTQSVVHGYGVLEVSMNRTSDGVWFGLHDQTTDRTSGGVYGRASDQTWAQIQAQQIVIGSQDAPQPYMRWEEIVAAYGSTHVLVLDPKYVLGSYGAEFLQMVRDDVDVNRVIMKFSGVGSGAANFSDAARAMGFETWGYFYAEDASDAFGNLQTWGPRWTLIGMDYTAPQSAWNEAIALGKPVIGHIAPTQAAYNMAMMKGAVGVQVSGVIEVAPVSWWT